MTEIERVCLAQPKQAIFLKGCGLLRYLDMLRHLRSRRRNRGSQLLQLAQRVPDYLRLHHLPSFKAVVGEPPIVTSATFPEEALPTSRPARRFHLGRTAHFARHFPALFLRPVIQLYSRHAVAGEVEVGVHRMLMLDDQAG